MQNADGDKKRNVYRAECFRPDCFKEEKESVCVFIFFRRAEKRQQANKRSRERCSWYFVYFHHNLTEVSNVGFSILFFSIFMKVAEMNQVQDPGIKSLSLKYQSTRYIYSLLLARKISIARFWRRYRRENIARTSEKYHFPCRWSQYLRTWNKN